MSSQAPHRTASPGDRRPGWEFWIDRGGTFTDVVARSPDGVLHTHKLLSDNPEQYRDAAAAGIAAVLARHGRPDDSVDVVKMGTTVATNALLERRGEPTLLAITCGHADALRIGYQSRPRLFDRHIVLPELLYSRVVEIDERVSVEGEVLRVLDEDAARRDLRAAFDDGLRSIAIVLLHGWRHRDHEARLAEIAGETGYTQISVSHEASPLIKLVGRGDTTVADAYLTPVLRRYLDRLESEIHGARLLLMQSNGGLAESSRFRGKDAVLSGPAGGIVGMASTAADAGFVRVIGFDMGGTSTDVSHFAGHENGGYERAWETTVAGVRLRAPMMAIHTIAAGGGSICRFDGARLRVGPESAGAVPGPASYRRGGPLTITDCNLLLGRLQPEFFPAVFGPDADQPLDPHIVRERFEALRSEIEQATQQSQTVEAIAQGFLSIANEAMSRAIKQISTQRGHDLSRYTLACFGGAGGQHACAVAELLGIDTVMLHPYAGVLSAYGMGLADLRVLREQSVEAPLSSQTMNALTALSDRLAEQANAALSEQSQASPLESTMLRRQAQLKYAGSDSALAVSFGGMQAMRVEFERMHRQRFGFDAPDKAVIVEMLAVEAIGKPRSGRAQPLAVESQTAGPIAQIRLSAHGHAVPIYDRDRLPEQWSARGPALLRESTGTVVVDSGWVASLDDRRNLILQRVADARAATQAGDATAVDPVRLELFNSRFSAVAEQMGEALRATAHSVNIKERLDFSCALFDRSGSLVANAPHIPVHLGSMGDSVRAIIRARESGRAFAPGDVYMLNAPYNGGTHLPDVTVVMPVFDAAGRDLLGYVAARGHHSDIGGITPGSMPPHSRSVEDEGVLIDDFLLVEAGRLREQDVRELLASNPHPARNPDQNIADLRAQIAACMQGAQALRDLFAEFGGEVVSAYLRHVQAHAEDCVRRLLDRVRDGASCVQMDDGSEIRVAVSVDRERRSARIDFSGTSAQVQSNFNAPISICRAATLYVLRCLIDEDIPLNDGCLAPIELIVPEGSLLNPRYPAAVVAGNVETSQAVTDALFAALQALAGSQGTMNNFTFGDERRQYYETICGGSGAGPGFDGASAVQTHMTNSRLTDPEVLETRFPVLVERFEIRRGSGGEGAYRGGDGVRRVLRFREPMQAAILSNRRRIAPSGLDGGADAALGVNRVERADGRVETLSAMAQISVQTGDAIVIETPGGGAYGRIR